MASSWSQTPAYPTSPDPTAEDSQWLQQLAQHPIFMPTQDRSNLPASSTDVGVQPQSMTVRGTDLLAAVGNELRICSLVDAKANSGHSLLASPSSSINPHAMAASGYKVITPTDGGVPLDVRHMCVNPTGKLLACIGDNQISVVVLPRSGYSKHVDRTITCRTVAVGPYYHSPHSESSVVKVLWHPWGESGSSLLVLTDDGVLREYDVAKDVEEPQQIASFLPARHGPAQGSRSATPSLLNRSSSSRGVNLTARDDDALTAVSFTLCVTDSPSFSASMFERGSQEAWTTAATEARLPTDWSPLTVYGLMKNGDIWAICPFLPKNALVPSVYIHGLANLISLKANAEDQDDRRTRYVNALLRQASSGDAQSQERSASSGVPESGAFARSRSRSVMDLDQVAEADRSQDVNLDQVMDVPVRLHPPSWSYAQSLTNGSGAKKAPRPQGPFLLKPAPIELCDERESSACDLIWTWLSRDTKQTATDVVAGVGILAVAGHDGRVDVGLILEPIEASWSNQRGHARSASVRRSQSSKPVKTNKYSLSDTEDEAEELFDNMTIHDGDGDQAPNLPCMFMYETINLGLLETVQDSGISSAAEASDFLLRRARPCFIRDPLYPDTIYIQHALGAQCLGFAKWTDKLLSALNTPSGSDTDSAQRREQALVKLLHEGVNTEVVWVVSTVVDVKNSPSTNPVTAISVLSDVYLSYAFLAITQDQQLVALELSLRVDLESAVSDVRPDSRAAVSVRDDAKKLYISLLGDGSAFQPPSLFTQASSVQGLSSRARRAVTANAGQLEMTPETLRTMGKAVEAYRYEIRDVVSAGNAVQARLDLQVREMTRQLEKLNTIRLRCDQLLGANAHQDSPQARMQRISQTQRALLARTDRALQKLMDHHQPDLSIYERQWFDELTHLATEVGLRPSSDSPTADYVMDSRSKKSLASKAEFLSHQLSLLRPQIEAEQLSKPAPQSGILGSEQLKRVEAMLSAEVTLLAESRAKVQELNRKIARLQPAASPSAADRTRSRSVIPTSSTAINLGDYGNASLSSSSHMFTRRM